MNREYHRWYSERLHRDMEFLVFGHGGAKVLVFPTRDGRFFEYENIGMINALRPKIEAGHLQLFCVEGLADEIFYCWWRHPADRIRRYLQLEDYLLHEILPFMASRNHHPCTMVTGCSLGAYYAANLAFRHPHLFQKLAAFSGRYDLTHSVEDFGNLFDGYYDENIYFNNPCHYLPNLDESWRIEALRRMDIVMVIGREDPFVHNNHYLSGVLHGKGIHHRLHEWEGRAHQGYHWRRMAPLYL
jgi:esterase/lipase superfamily enzyme